MHRNEINVMMISDDNYIKYAVVLSKSILMNNPLRNVNFYIIGDYVSMENEHLLDELSTKWSQARVVKFILLHPDISVFNPFGYVTDFQKRLLFELFPHVYLPKSLDRVLFLDIDVIVNDNIEIFYDVDFNQQGRENVLVAASWSGSAYGGSTGLDYVPKKEDVIMPDRYVSEPHINAGVVLFNLELMRRNNYDVNFYLKNLKPTQELILYEAFKGKIAYLNAIYNYRILSEEKYEQANMNVTDVSIIHYAKIGTVGILYYDKPWMLLCDEDDLNYCIPPYVGQNSRVHKYYSIWWKYASIIPEVACTLKYEMEIRKRCHSIYVDILDNQQPFVRYVTGCNSDEDLLIMSRNLIDGRYSLQNVSLAVSFLAQLVDKGSKLPQVATIINRSNDPIVDKLLTDNEKSLRCRVSPLRAVRVGRRYRDGNGVDPDLGKAATWMRGAADANPDFTNELADVLVRIGDDDSIAEAVSRLEARSESGDRGSKSRLETMYGNGIGVKKVVDAEQLLLNHSDNSGKD